MIVSCLKKKLVIWTLDALEFFGFVTTRGLGWSKEREGLIVSVRQDDEFVRPRTKLTRRIWLGRIWDSWPHSRLSSEQGRVYESAGIHHWINSKML